MSNPVSSIRIKNFLNGEWVEETGVDYVPLFNPSTGAQIGEVPLSNPDTSLKAVESAYAAYDSWRNLSVNKRVSYLYDIRQAMIDKEEDLAVAIAVDQAKHVSEARGEVQRVVQIIETACSIPTLIQGESLDHIAGNINGRVIKSPLGVFCGVAPFNFPALVFGWFIPFAIGVGNTFVFKPSTQSPYFMQKMGDIFNDVGLPKGVINIIHGNRTVVQPWYEDSRVSGVCLVGSTPTAKKMAEACGRGGKRSMLLGGAKNFLVVMEDVQWDVFLENYLHSCYGSAGQRCLAGSVVAAVPEIHDELVEKVMSVSRDVKIGSAMDPDIYMGPVISAKAKEKIERYIEIGVKEGANLVIDGRNPKVPEEFKSGYYVGPTIFIDVTPDMTIYKEEIFGPVLSLIGYQDDEEAVRIANDTEYGLSGYISGDSDRAKAMAKRIRTGNVHLNGAPVDNNAPFGGYKHSGNGREWGRYGFEEFLETKAIMGYNAK